MAETLTAQRPERSRRRSPRVVRLLAPIFNRPVLLIAGTRFLPFWALIRHRGRRSGRVYTTPVAARRTADGFAIPLAFGELADWCRNTLANGGCVIRWSGSDYPVRDPVVVDAEAALAAFRPLERRILRRVGIRKVMLVRGSSREARP